MTEAIPKGIRYIFVTALTATIGMKHFSHIG
jgi:hypothetical protein